MGYSYDHIPKTHFEMFSVLNAEFVKNLAKVASSLYSQDIVGKMPTRKGDIIELILNILSKDDNLKKTYNKLISKEKTLIEEAVHTYQGSIDQEQFFAKHGFIIELNPESIMSYYERSRNLLSPVHLLISRSGNIPNDLLLKLVKFVPKPKKLILKYVSDIPEKISLSGSRNNAEEKIEIHETEKSACHDVIAMLHLVNDKKIKASDKTLKVNKSSIKHIHNSLISGDYYDLELEAKDKYDVQIGHLRIKPFAWPLLLQASNLAICKNNYLELTAKGKKSLSLPSHEIIKDIFQRWVKTSILNEFSRIDVIKGQKSKSRPLYKPQNAREKIIKILSSLEEGKWVAVNELFTYIIASGNRFNIVRNPWALYIFDAEYGSMGYDNINWNHLEGRFARVFLLEYMATLGLIDVAVIPPWHSQSDLKELYCEDISCISRYDGLLYIKRTPLSNWVLGLSDVYEEKILSKKEIQVLANFEIIISSRVLPADKLLLNKFCESVSDRVWKISHKKILSSIELGDRLDRFIKFLKDHSNNQLPGTVISFFADINKKINSLKFISNCHLVYCESSVLMSLIKNDTKIKTICNIIDNNHFIIPYGQENQIATILKRKGYILPKI